MKNYKLKNVIYILFIVLSYVLFVVFIYKIPSITFIDNYKYKYILFVFLYVFFLIVIYKYIFNSFVLSKTIKNKNEDGYNICFFKSFINYYVTIYISSYISSKNFLNSQINNKNIEIQISYFKLLKIMRFKSPKMFIKSDVNCLKLFLDLGLNDLYDVMILNNEELKKEIRKSKIKSII